MLVDMVAPAASAPFSLILRGDCSLAALSTIWGIPTTLLADHSLMTEELNNYRTPASELALFWAKHPSEASTPGPFVILHRFA